MRNPSHGWNSEQGTMLFTSAWKKRWAGAWIYSDLLIHKQCLMFGWTVRDLWGTQSENWSQDSVRKRILRFLWPTLMLTRRWHQQRRIVITMWKVAILWMSARIYPQLLLSFLNEHGKRPWKQGWRLRMGSVTWTGPPWPLLYLRPANRQNLRHSYGTIPLVILPATGRMITSNHFHHGALGSFE